MVRCRNAELHFLNCYWNSSVSNYYVCPEHSSAYFEGCTFAGKANTNKKNWKEYKGTEGQNYCKFVNCSGKGLTNAGSVSAPSYAYDQMSASAAKTTVTNSSCGAGATLTVTKAGAVSSSCDNPMDIDHVANESAAHKVLRNGQVLILREDATYDIFGRRVD